MQETNTSAVKVGLVSIIICNYNYERFVEASISSALAVDWPQVEVIVVDDGSTDRSREVIEGFASRGVTALFRPNKGQARAADEGYRYSRGEWILFLDADDTVDPSIVREAVAAMKPGWSMIQCQMMGVDEFGRSLNNIFPRYRKDITPTLIRRWVAETDTYPTPPTSGNLLSREFLDKIFPLEEGMDRAVDSYFLATAPLLGDVLTVNKPLAFYRLHQNNFSAQLVLDISRLQRDFMGHLRRCNYGTRIAEKYGVSVPPDRWRFGFYNLAMRIASLRFAPTEHPLPGDTIGKCLKDWTKSVSIPQGMTPLRHAAMSVWLLNVALAPQSVARTLVSWRFAPQSRPGFLKFLIRAA